MTRSIQAVYENGVLRPLEPVDLSENVKVTLTIAPSPPAAGEEEWLDTEFHASCAREADPSISLDAVRAALAKIRGPMTEDFIAERDER
jgi:predicted DNA-binding antitoxin AbrB/MazE fold protein